jgi:ubiquinone/menaquinone biosynthesis C-methylase UbiE
VAAPTYEELSRPLPAWHPKAWYYGATAVVLRTVGRLSAGIDVGFRHGFDSGLMMEYVYEDRPQGRGWIGRTIDRTYLGAIGWRGIRIRKANLEAVLADLIAERRRAGKQTMIADLATGTGRYLLQTLAARGEDGVRAVLRDLAPAGLEAGRRRAAELGLRNVTFETGNAFDQASLATIQPAPNIVVVSGLYEILPDDELIRPHFGQVRRILADGGAFVFTAQPHHPQVELIARTLVNRDGQPWVMRLRSIETLTAWARDAGFTEFSSRTDPWGIFHVITAR